VATFQETLDALTERVTSSATTTATAVAMADALTDIAAGYLGGDLTMSGVGSAVIDPATADGAAVVRTGGVYGLADGGRRAVRRATAPRRSALATPWGPRASVAGSTWAGFHITDRARGDVLEAGRQAIRDAAGIK
jgi:hypothetical protein